MFFKQLTDLTIKAGQIAGFGLQQVRFKWPEHRMKRDYLRRMVVKEHHITRLRLNGIRKNTILPKELREVADVEIANEPIRSSITWLTNRCAITGRARGNVLKYRLSRFVFRHNADHNKLAGVQRAMWT